jgi:hypothetical protein
MQSSEPSLILTFDSIEHGRRIRELQIHKFSDSGEASIGGSVFAMFHLDYFSCFLTVLATILLTRKSWIGLLLAIVNSLIVCVIGLRTSQLGFIPANLFCICVYAFSMRPWLKEHTHANRDQAQRQESLVISIHNCPPQRGLLSSPAQSIISPEVRSDYQNT